MLNKCIVESFQIAKIDHRFIYLSSQANHLETETISYEEKEQQLVNDCVKELREFYIFFFSYLSLKFQWL